MKQRLHSSLTVTFPEFYQAWIKRFPFDLENQKGLELTSIFLKSCEYKEDDSKLNENFLKFCQSFWHLVTDQSPHINKEVFFEVPEFHIHYYTDSTQKLRGPHLKDMTSEVISALELKNKMDELVASATLENPVLVHTSTGDDLYDHSYGALWLGQTLPLNFSKLD
jgi:aromatic ring-cleaving dioxygenase